MIHVIILSQQHRSRLLQQIIDALNSQTVKPDKITVVFQGYKKALNSEIDLRTIYLERNLGSIIRFKYAMSNATNITLDDDMIPAQNYIECLKGFIDRKPDSIGSLWGYKVKGKGSYIETFESIPCWDELEDDSRVLMVGAGLMVWNEGYHNLRAVRFDLALFCDMQLALHCAHNDIKLFAAAHKGNEVTHIGDNDIQENAIWKQSMEDIEFLDESTYYLLKSFEK